MSDLATKRDRADALAVRLMDLELAYRQAEKAVGALEWGSPGHDVSYIRETVGRLMFMRRAITDRLNAALAEAEDLTEALGDDPYLCAMCGAEHHNPRSVTCRAHDVLARDRQRGGA